MAERIHCRHCEASFVVKDSLLGKKVRCPECEEINQTRRPTDDEEETSVSATRRPLAKATNRLRREDETEDEAPRRRSLRDEEDLDDERPRKKKKKRAPASGVSPILIVGGGLLALLPIIGLIVWLASGGVKGANGAPNTQAGALAYNQKIVAANQRLAEAGKQFGMALGNRNALAARTQYQNTLNVIQAIRAEMPTWGVPSTAAAKNLHQGYERFLQGQEESVKKFGDAVAILENGAINPQMKGQQINQILQAVEAAERPQLAELQRLQGIFARENNIILMP